MTGTVAAGLSAALQPSEAEVSDRAKYWDVALAASCTAWLSDSSMGVQPPTERRLQTHIWCSELRSM